MEIDGCVTEKYVWPKIQRKCDYLALLGDIGNPFSEAYESFLADLSPKFKKIILIAGNTDYYNQDESSVQYTMQEVEVQISKLCKKYGNIDFLQRKCLRIDEVRYMIIGCTLWSRVQSEYVIKNWEDYKYIKVMDKNLNRIRDLTAKDTNQFHDDDLRFINQYIEEAQKIQYNLIVLTHFAPIKRNTLQENYRCTLQQTQASDLEFLMKQSQIIKLWAFGHTHHSSDQMVNKTRVVSNQHGFYNENFDVNLHQKYKDPCFDKDYVINLNYNPEEIINAKKGCYENY